MAQGYAQTPSLWPVSTDMFGSTAAGSSGGFTPPIADVLAKLLLCLLIPSCAIAGVLIYRLCLHPLSRVPGPKAAAVSNIWHARHVRNGHMLKLGKTLHKEYGPAVRVGPNEVWFDSPEAFQMIYSTANGFEKSPFYFATVLRKPTVKWLPSIRFEHGDTLDLLSERDMSRYRRQRRLIGRTYHLTQLKKHEKAIDEVIQKAIAQITSLGGAEVDLKEWMHIIIVECLAAVVLSSSVGFLRDKTDHGSGSQGYLSWRKKCVIGLFPVVAMADWFAPAFVRAFSTVWGLSWKPPSGFKSFFTGVQAKISRRVRTALSEKPAVNRRQDLLADLIALHQAKPEFTETYLRRMAMTNFGAGHETMASALTAVIAMIGSDIHAQNRIVKEVRSQEPSEDAISYDTASSLEFTTASIREAQRLHPAIGMSLSRTVPPGGMQAHGHFFPAGTTVGCNPVSLHRNPEIYGEDAENFRLERWLEADREARRAMQRYNLTWGGGARTCPGRHLAELVLYKVVPALVREFEIQAVVPPDHDMPYYFVAMMTGVQARFLKRGQDRTT